MRALFSLARRSCSSMSSFIVGQRGRTGSIFLGAAFIMAASCRHSATHLPRDPRCSDRHAFAHAKARPLGRRQPRDLNLYGLVRRTTGDLGRQEPAQEGAEGARVGLRHVDEVVLAAETGSAVIGSTTSPPSAG